MKFADNYILTYTAETSLTFPKDYDGEEIVATVIEKNLDGSRGQNFDPSKGSFSAWLKFQIESEIKTKASWKRNISEVAYPMTAEEDYNDELLHHLAKNQMPSPHLQSSHPENILISEQEAEELWDQIYTAVEGDEYQSKIVEAIENGISIKPRYLAREYGWDEKSTQNALKRFMRNVRALLRRSE